MYFSIFCGNDAAEESFLEDNGVELIFHQSPSPVHKFGRSSLDCAMHHGLLSVPERDDGLVRRRSDPGVRQYSLAGAICALNASLANIINATSFSTVTNNSSSISRLIEDAASFKALRSSSSSSSTRHREGGDILRSSSSRHCSSNSGAGRPLRSSSSDTDDDRRRGRCGFSPGGGVVGSTVDSSGESTTRSLDSLSAECGDSESLSVSEAAPAESAPVHALLVNGDVLQTIRLRGSQLTVKPVRQSGESLLSVCRLDCVAGINLIFGI